MNLAPRQTVIRRNAISKYVDTPKSGHGRVIDLSAELTSALERHRKATPSTTGRVMLQDTGQPLARSAPLCVDACSDGFRGHPAQEGRSRQMLLREEAPSVLSAIGCAPERKALFFNYTAAS